MVLSTQLVLAKEVLGDAKEVRRWMRGDHEAAVLRVSAMMASASGAASSRKSNPALAAALLAGPGSARRRASGSMAADP